MKRAVKLILWVGGLLVAFIVTAVIVVPLVVDPNDYRDEINTLVERQTGRELVIEGDIGLSVFPWLGLEIGETRLANAEGFGPEPFARIAAADVRVKLLPLLRKEVEVDTVVLTGLRLNLARNAAGATNWDDLVKAPAEGAAPARTPPEGEKGAGPQEALAALAIGGVRITDAHIVWDDRLAGQRAEVRNFALETGALDLTAPFPVTLDTDFSVSEPQARGHLALKAEVALDLAAQQYRLDGLTVALDLNSPLVPGGTLAARLTAVVSADLQRQVAEIKALKLEALGTQLALDARATAILGQPAGQGQVTLDIVDGGRLLAPFAAALPPGMQPGALSGARLEAPFEFDLATQRAALPALRLAALGIRAEAKVAAEQIIDSPAASGQLTVEPFVPRDVAATLGVTLPEMADPSALTKAALTTGFAVAADRAGVSGLKLQFDETTVSGDASVARFAAPVIRYALAVDAIDVDRYLPPPSTEPQPPATPAGAAAAGAAQLPLDLLRSLDIDGRLTVAKLKVSNLRSTDILFALKADKGLFRASPTRARLYQGSYEGTSVFDVRSDTPKLALQERLTGVQAGPLLEDFMGKAYVTGSANVSADVTAAGLDPLQVRKTLNGTAAFQFNDGAVMGINIAQKIREAVATAKGQPAPKEEAQQTDFAEVKGSVTVTDGLVRNKDLSAKSPLLRIEGEGSVNLVAETLDYLLQAAVVGTLEGQGGKELAEVKGLTIPVRIKGPFAEPKISVELDKLLEAKAKAAIEAEKKKAQEQVDKRLKEEEEKLKKGLEKELLKLFK
jgi:AsmA protein